jgi:GntR family trehalose operon transcriptional repressor
MGKKKYDKIYEDLKKKIESKIYVYQQMLPSESNLVREYQCSRNTLRRAVAQLALEGYLQSLHGKGVCVIYEQHKKFEFMLGDIETFKEASERNNGENKTEVIHFSEITADETVYKKTGIPEGTEIYYIQRLRFMDGQALIIDHNYYRKDIVRDLTLKTAENSIYEYIENELNEKVVTTKRIVTVEKAAENDFKYLELKDYNCVAVISNYTYNADGIMFEYTQSRHRPDCFVFFGQAKRIKNT